MATLGSKIMSNTKRKVVDGGGMELTTREKFVDGTRMGIELDINIAHNETM